MLEREHVYALRQMLSENLLGSLTAFSLSRLPTQNVVAHYSS